MAPWRRDPSGPGALAYLGTVLVTTAVVAGGPAGEVFVPLYGFVAVVAAMHMRPAVAVRHLAAIIAATALLVALGGLSLARAAILLSVVVVMAAVDVETRDQLLAIADRHATRIQGLSDDLLTAERVRHGRLALQYSPVAASDLLAQVAATHSGAVEVAASPGLTLWADTDRLSQVLLNLLRNAVVHGEPPVELVARPSDGGVRLEVRDHGPGVPGELEEAIFDGFTGGDRPDWVGLGLWIVRTLVEAHGGHVDHEHADPGARFVVWLPAVPARTAVAADRHDERPPRSGEVVQPHPGH